MSDRIDPSSWPSPRGPWPEVHDPSRLYDHGRRWCVNSAGHPGADGYPDPQLHHPWHECQGPAVWLEDVRRELTGEQIEVSVCVAAPYRFGQPRAPHDTTSIRVVIDASAIGAEEPTLRMSLGLGEALRLARILNHLVDAISLPNQAA